VLPLQHSFPLLYLLPHSMAPLHFEQARYRMVKEHLIPMGILDARVLTAMRKVPRHVFVEGALAHRAYENTPLPIGSKQTISQPYMVALMAQSVGLTGSEKVLELGTGSGYQAAVLAELAGQVYSIERIRSLYEKATKVLGELHYNIFLRCADGTLGWQEAAPFDAILVAAAAPQIPTLLIGQLKVGGQLIIPVGNRTTQVLQRVIKQEGQPIIQTLTPCTFVPLLGKWGWQHEGVAP